ncbi:MAG: metallophosphoesterase family protein [Planctomycetota bacterium]|jgi:3',5'-cyclic AMP phosphodiesterase CpdA
MTGFLVGSDFHLGPLCDAFEARLREDVIPVFCGDLINRPRADADVFFETVARWEAANPDLVVVPGNHEPEDCGPWEALQVHERRGLRLLALPVTPLMAKIPTWTHEYSESRIADLLAPFEGGRYDVIVSHAPPHGVCDRVFWGERIGSRALRAFARAVSFRLWLCGHVHEERGREGELEGRPLFNAARTILDVPLPAPVPSGSASPP